MSSTMWSLSVISLTSVLFYTIMSNTHTMNLPCVLNLLVSLRKKDLLDCMWLGVLVVFTSSIYLFLATVSNSSFRIIQFWVDHISGFLFSRLHRFPTLPSVGPVYPKIFSLTTFTPSSSISPVLCLYRNI